MIEKCLGEENTRGAAVVMPRSVYFGSAKTMYQQSYADMLAGNKGARAAVQLRALVSSKNDEPHVVKLQLADMLINYLPPFFHNLEIYLQVLLSDWLTGWLAGWLAE